jgi:hypothetical protein
MQDKREAEVSQFKKLSIIVDRLLACPIAVHEKPETRQRPAFSSYYIHYPRR